jgi:MFS family permease
VGRRLNTARALAIDISPLRDSVPFRALWVGQLVSLFGTHMRIIAVSLQVFAITGSSAAVGLIGLAEIVPLIAFSIIGGPLVDTFDRRRIMAVTQTLLLVDSAALAAVTLTGDPSVMQIYVLVALASALTAIDHPARNALTPTFVKAEQIPAAMALRQVVFQTTLIAGPAVGGLLITALDGVGWVYVVDAATFLVGLVALRWVPFREKTAPEAPEETRASPRAIGEGLRFAFRNPLILSIFAIDLVAMVFGMPRAVFPALAQETFAVNATGLGLLYAAPSVGALLGALSSGWIRNVERRGVAVLTAVVVWGAAITLAGLALASFALTLALLAVAGAADVVSAVFRGSMLLDETPDALLGRVNSLNLMVVTGGPRLGDVEAGLVAQLIGPEESVVAGGIACLAGTFIVGAWSRPLRRYRTLRSKSPARSESSPE